MRKGERGRILKVFQIEGSWQELSGNDDLRNAGYHRGYFLKIEAIGLTVNFETDYHHRSYEFRSFSLSVGYILRD